MTNKLSLITGASNGIGRAIAIDLAKNGYDIIATFNKDKKSALSLKKEINKLGMSCELLKINFSKINQINQLEKIVKKYKKLDVLVNNAGYLNQMPFKKINFSEWEKTININFSSIFFLIQTLSKYKKKSHNGSIINISSIGGQTGGTKAPHYAAAKLAVISLTKSFANILAAQKIRVNAISPGVIETKLVRKFIKKEGRNNIEAKIPLGKIGNVLDISNSVVFLASEKSCYITGQIININGGLYSGW